LTAFVTVRATQLAPASANVITVAIRSFLRYPLTIDLIVRWVTQAGSRPRRFPARRLDVIRPFARYRAAHEPATEVPPHGLLGRSRRRPIHHIYTPAELAALVSAARHLGPAGGARAASYATLFGLLAASGWRAVPRCRTRPCPACSGG